METPDERQKLLNYAYDNLHYIQMHYRIQN